MQVITRTIPCPSRHDALTIVPIGDVHIGAAACDEDLLRRVVQRVADDPTCFWLGMGDYCEFIPVHDHKRFNSATLSPWILTGHLGDLARAQVKRFLDIVRPIAPKCLALLAGNHETFIHQHFERDVYSEIVTGIKEEAGWKDDYPLALGYNGWLILRFYRAKDLIDKKSSSVSTIRLRLHHGFTGGKLAGAKALDMQRWLWSHDCDLLLFGHSHHTGIQPEGVEMVDAAGNVRIQVRKGAHTGTFLRSFNVGAASYSEVKGYMPLPISGVEIHLRPHATNYQERIRLVL